MKTISLLFLILFGLNLSPNLDDIKISESKVITGKVKNPLLGHGRVIHGTATLYGDGYFESTLKLKCDHALKGFTGGVEWRFYDSKGKQIYVRISGAYGVSPKMPLVSNNKRTEHMKGKIPTSVMKKTVKIIGVAQTRKGKSSLCKLFDCKKLEAAAKAAATALLLKKITKNDLR